MLVDGKLTLTAADGSPMGTLSKSIAQSPTLGQPPPGGAVVLFDGTNVQQWIGGRITADHCLAAGTVTKASLHDFFLHLEFCLPVFASGSRPAARQQRRLSAEPL